MKKCPVCNRTYTDESQNFCLEDGTTLIADPASASGFGSMPSAAQSWHPNVPQNFSAPPRKKSNTALWVLGILGVVVVVGVVGFFGLLIAIGIAVDNDNNNNSRNYNTRSNSNSGSNTNSSANSISTRNVSNSGTTSNTSYNSGTNSSTTTGSLKYSEMDWGKLDSAFGRGEYTGGEYRVNSKKSDNYYVIIVDAVVKDQYVTKNATTKITARTVSSDSPYLGFGLVVHSDPLPLKRDYAFVIRTGSDPAFRVVKHEDKIETDVVKWTSASQIRSGTQPNDLEVRSNGKTLEFYINGQFATSIADNITTKGIVGLYTSGTPVVAFSDLRIYDNK